MALPVNAGDATHQEAPLEPAANRSPPDPIEADRLRTHLATTVGHPCAGSTPAPDRSRHLCTQTPFHYPPWHWLHLATASPCWPRHQSKPRRRQLHVASATGGPSTSTSTTHIRNSVLSSMRTDRRTPRGCSPLPPPSLFFFSLHTSGMARGVVIDGFIISARSFAARE